MISTEKRMYCEFTDDYSLNVVESFQCANGLQLRKRESQMKMHSKLLLRVQCKEKRRKLFVTICKLRLQQ